MNILIVRLSSIGDIIHTLPAIPLLKAQMPESTITWVAEPDGAELLAVYPGIDRVFVLPKQKITGSCQRGNFLRAFRSISEFVHELREVYYDIILDFQGLLKSALVVRTARGKRKIGFSPAREGASFFYTERVPSADFNAHGIQRNLVLLSALGIKQYSVSFLQLFDTHDIDRLAQILTHEDIDGTKKIVCVHPCSRWRTKLWGQEKIALLCDLLHHECKCEVVLVGGEKEQQVVSTIAQRCQTPVHNLAGILPLRVFAALLRKSSLLVTPDSGPMHLACAVDTPVVALFGPTAPWRTGPFTMQSTVIRKDLPCSPCYKRRTCPCKNHRCMEDITVAEVFEVCCNYLKK